MSKPKHVINETEIEFEIENNLMAKTVTFYEKIFYLEVPPAQLVLYQFILIQIQKNPTNKFTEEYLARYMAKDVRSIRRYLVDLQEKGLIEIINIKTGEGRYAPNRYRILDVDLIQQTFSDRNLLNNDYKLDYSTKSKIIRRNQRITGKSPSDTSVHTEISVFQGSQIMEITNGHQCPTLKNTKNTDRTQVSDDNPVHQCPHSTYSDCIDSDCIGNSSLNSEQEPQGDIANENESASNTLPINPKLLDVLIKYNFNPASPTARDLLDICEKEDSRPEELDKALFDYFKFKEEGGVFKKSRFAFVRARLQNYKNERNMDSVSTPEHVKLALNKKALTSASASHVKPQGGTYSKQKTSMKYENFYL